MNKIAPAFLHDLGIDHQSHPDGIEPDYLSVSENHVISRDKLGHVVSRFKDIKWDFSHYVNREIRLNFERFYDSDKSNGGEVYQDIKLCCFYLFYLPKHRAIRTSIIAAENLFVFGDIALKNGVSFREALDDISIIESIASEERFSGKEKYSKLSRILASFNRLGKISSSFPAVCFVPNTETYSLALKYYNTFKKNRTFSQTPVIPTRLFSEIIIECADTLNTIYLETGIVIDEKNMLVYEVIEKLLEDTISICLSSLELPSESECIDFMPRKYFRSKVWTLRFSKEQEVYWNALKPYGISNFKELKSFYAYFFLCGRCLTQIFTGMRVEEASSVPFNGFESYDIEGDKIYFIRSWTTKVESESARFTRWFTSDFFVDFNASIQIMVRIYYSKYKAIDIDSVDQSKYPLFPAIVGKTQTSPYFNYPSFNKFTSNHGWRPYAPFTKNPVRFCITNEDMKELQQQDRMIDWEEKGFKVGDYFPFASHQFRRSLVVYAARSGLVSLPSLQSNLKHLVQAMTAYYAVGASYAENFILSSKNDSRESKPIKSLVRDFREEVSVAEAELMWEEMIEAEDELFGVHGAFIQRRKNTGTLPIVFESRESILKAVKKGKLAYKKTPLGGCSSVEFCEKATFISITACVLCDKAVFNNVSVSKLKKAKCDFNNKLLKFDMDSPYAHQIKKEIRAIDTILSSRIASIKAKNNE